MSKQQIEYAVSFDVSRADSALIKACVDRLTKSHGERGKRNQFQVAGRTVQDWLMDLTAVHANGCPLRLAKLCEADDFNFLHDMYGIARHLDRDTGKLGGCFVPRFAKPRS